MPNFVLNFLDSEGSASQVNGEVKVSVTCPDLTVTCDESEGPWVFEVILLIYFTLGFLY